eukprot:TRINITY_DN4706_c0_g1_i1.p1 TRINITY_DN4706_c0_g1~~TRINITY_DN4706_c0_g1_i1.p1  ORF type:complete len:185 (+),score=52.67 TRINITY_DN4706_c0_g1_i1:70-624(+)
MCIRDRYQRRVHGEQINKQKRIFLQNNTINKKMKSQERSFIMVKPDGVQRGLVGKIMKRFEERGYKLVAMKMIQAPKELLEQHYKDLKEKSFFPGLIKYMQSGPVVPMVFEGTDIVNTGRNMLGKTKPLESNPGTIRGDFCIDVGRNIIHGSDSVESAKREISLWFKAEELCDYKLNQFQWIYE